MAIPIYTKNLSVYISSISLILSGNMSSILLFVVVVLTLDDILTKYYIYAVRGRRIGSPLTLEWKEIPR